jgi:hypothetical protein
MKRSEIREIIKAGVDSLTPVLQFWDGELSDWNAKRDNRYPGVLSILDSVESKYAQNMSPLDSWPIRLLVCKIDKMDSNPSDYESIVDSCDEIAQKLIYYYRDNALSYDITTASRKRFIKKHADCLTGVELTFTIQANDKTRVC